MLAAAVPMLFSGIRLRQRISWGWYGAVFVIGLEFANVTMQSVQGVIEILKAPVEVLEAPRGEYLSSLFWGDFFWLGFVNAVFLIYLSRPTVRQECRV